MLPQMARPQCPGADAAMTHMLGSWSQRLAGKTESKSGHCCTCHMMLDDTDDAQALRDIAQLLALAGRAAARIGASPALAHRILLDAVNLVITAAEHHGAATAAYQAIRDVLVSIRDNSNPHSDISPPLIGPKHKEVYMPLPP